MQLDTQSQRFLILTKTTPSPSKSESLSLNALNIPKLHGAAVLSVQHHIHMGHRSPKTCGHQRTRSATSRNRGTRPPRLRPRDHVLRHDHSAHAGESRTWKRFSPAIAPTIVTHLTRGGVCTTPKGSPPSHSRSQPTSPHRSMEHHAHRSKRLPKSA